MVTASFYLFTVLGAQAIACAYLGQESSCALALARSGTEVYMNNQDPAWLKSRADFGRDPEGVYEVLEEGAYQLVTQLKEERGQ